MSTTYAEPQLQNLTIDVFPAGSNTPILTKQAGSPIFTPVTNSSIVPSSKNSDLAKPNNLPPVQQKLRDDNQYRTIDLRPRTKAPAPTPPKQNNQVPGTRTQDPRYPSGVTAVDVEGTAALGAFTLGVYDQMTGTNPIGNPNARRQNQREVFRPLDDVAYRLGRRAAGGAQDAVNDAKESIKKTRDTIWKNRPQFEIPQLKIPEVKLPEFKLPEIPEFKFPEISFPKPPTIPIPQLKPKPQNKTIKIPDDVEKLIRESEGKCGKITFRMAFITKAIGTQLVVNPDGSSYEQLQKIPANFDEYISTRKKFIISRAIYFGETPPELDTTIKAIETSGGSGFTNVQNSGNLKFVARYGVYQNIPEEGTWRGLSGDAGRLPRYEGTYAVVEVPSDGSPNAVLDYLINPLESQNYSVYFYDFQSLSTAEGCYIPEASPPSPLPPPPPPPQPDPPTQKPDDMNCCDDLKKLLMLILRRIGPLPASVPNSLIRANSGNQTIESLAQYIAYSVIQTNAQFGQFPQEIKIQDADLTQEGNQEKIIKLPNLAESIAEMMGVLLILQAESNANLVATINAMIEAGSAKQSAILASDYAAANAEFLGYKGKQIERNVPFSFKPGEQQLDQMLQPTEVKVKGFDNDDKNDLNDALMPILEMAAMYRAQNFRNLGTSDTLAKIKSILTDASNISTAIDYLINNQPSTNPDAPSQPKKSDWDSFIEQAESGFITQPGITDSVHPYNRTLDQRPKIKEIGTDTTENPT